MQGLPNRGLLRCSLLCVIHAGNNEIDNGLLELLQENIDAAKAAGQPEPAQFMEKVRDAAKKFVMS